MDKKLKYFTVVTIFVNPAQFNNQNDLKKYPSQEKKDLEVKNRRDRDGGRKPEEYIDDSGRIKDFDRHFQAVWYAL